VRVTQYRRRTDHGQPDPLEVDAPAIHRLEDTENEQDETETVVRFSPVIVVAYDSSVSQSPVPSARCPVSSTQCPALYAEDPV
jgi:hypothetical protein